ncbi:cytochrome-c oxidase, cbb3-type subunit III [Sulfitobacter sp. M57]|uniref:cytochrome-c oxidase, cbb3-type subunit III n=1 Tax=unclassified Sulfitobacter TaxID=196795 RepID=UPI0023E25470|nr:MULTISPECIES: cytochrome-c oxidase, cbb3-type subunit III [unclassified Sulfitobacter]MDF3413371.1 cytochrome-c oxidase, cbb3-type subunit III [Sulfitobacter sp. KE5]MDF3421349.1 cytochrome-c oxidase, cbb3-type subunit III [Sulfitobacter sp. KE43]MDF3431918.1 cytochrome-c oxidase, cbb3-type subunit III [Sulfitobacter sp. KE42]MDF3457558.1 cytochrome-c oxidase, cbb3-type subunit III [Sulfitobacter sp. S74]MDF3461460.1 cytochrome-c oxidase, cbb3-type subunit III [Sulfitobacter sp. Ks18]
MSDPTDKKPVDEVTGTETTGHVWDGIEELNNPLPRWWLWALYLTIIWGIGYVIAYPAWPMISKATPGLLGFSTRGEVARDIDSFREASAARDAQLASADLSTLADDVELNRYAVSSGAAVFRNNCSQCHGSGAAGAKGYPNLLDDDWLWGGDHASIAYTVRHGIRNDSDEDARYSEMPAFGELLEDGEIPALVEYVRQLADEEYDASLASAGEPLFADNCSACHGDAGTGDREQGAPNLTDAIWLYGGDRESLTQTITYSRFGVMPPWGTRLTEAQVQAVAAYVYQLGGGEADTPSN